uniref:Uncharacterized protein n=1 Tax=Anguilla anguilla TaxID=7936 RepID=A0A0E9R0Z9_ANGAN
MACAMAYAALYTL